ncbi:MAG: hypothetical protein IJU18_05800 [Oscillospiraceae bacterium]|nr:hypothetical protein [Oscillospiraceae bacterium]
MRRFDQGRVSRSRFMEGRYGPDALGRFASVCGCLLLIIALLVRTVADGVVTNLLVSLALAVVGWTYFRILSKNLTRRQLENQRYLQLVQPAADWFALRIDCFRQRRDYAFFKCPGCGRTVRVPKGKGRIRITCRHCGFSFEKKT